MPTPFISTTPSLIWVVKLAKANGPSGRIAMIEPRALNPTAYCIAPLCARVKASGKANFSGYRGEFEYWAWQHVRMIQSEQEQILIDRYHRMP